MLQREADCFVRRHMHDDEEIRYAIKGGAFFDVRGRCLAQWATFRGSTEVNLAIELPTDNWIRVHVHDGDLLVLPAGIYHRFSLDSNESVRMMRLFKVRQQTSSLLLQERNMIVGYRMSQSG